MSPWGIWIQEKKHNIRNVTIRTFFLSILFLAISRHLIPPDLEQISLKIHVNPLLNANFKKLEIQNCVITLTALSDLLNIRLGYQLTQNVTMGEETSVSYFGRFKPLS